MQLNKLTPGMRAAGWLALPAGGEAALKEGHYAYLLPGYAEEPRPAYFRNGKLAEAWHLESDSGLPH